MSWQGLVFEWLKCKIRDGKMVHLSFGHGHPRDFFRGVGNEGVWRTEVPQRGPGAEPQWGSERWRHFLKIMQYFIYWDFWKHMHHKKHSTTFSGESKCPRPCPCLRPLSVTVCLSLALQRLRWGTLWAKNWRWENGLASHYNLTTGTSIVL